MNTKYLPEYFPLWSSHNVDGPMMIPAIFPDQAAGLADI